MKKYNPVSSSVISGYELLKQHIELEQDKDYLANIDQIQRKRRIPQPGKKSSQNTASTSNQIKDMDIHWIPFPEFYNKLNLVEQNAKIGLTIEEAEKRNKE